MSYLEKILLLLLPSSTLTLSVQPLMLCTYNADAVLCSGFRALSSEPNETGKYGHKQQLTEMKSAEVAISVSQQIAPNQRLVLLAEARLKRRLRVKVRFHIHLPRTTTTPSCNDDDNNNINYY